MSDGLSRWSRAGGLLLLAAMAIAALPWPPGAAAATKPAFVQGKFFQVRSGTSVSATFSTANKAGNLLVVYVVWDNSAPVAITDTAGNTYVSAIGPTRRNGDRANAQIFYAKNVAAASANKVTARFSTAITAYGSLYVHEYSGVDRTAPVDTTVSAVGTSPTMTSGTLAARNPNTLLFAGGASNVTVITAGPTYKIRARIYGNVTADYVPLVAGSYSAIGVQNGSSWIMQLVAFRPAGSAPVDTTAPSVPGNLEASGVTATAATISWSASTDDTGVAGYRVSRNGTQVATTAARSFADALLTPATAYTYTVAAFDQAGNVSAPSSPLVVTTLAGTAGPAYPLKVGPTRRYLVDQNGVPVLITGDSPQALIANLSEAEAESFLADRQAAGFNLVWVNLLCATYTGGRPDGSTYDGIVPFTTPGDIATPNEAYFARVDAMLRLAAQHGITVLLDPAETGSFLSVLTSNGVAKSRAYGRYLGARYRGFDNIIWMSGNDFQSWANPGDDAVVQAVALGIRETDDRHIHTVELDYPVSGSLDDPGWAPIIDLNASYTYYPTYAQVLADYNRPGPVPTFLVEANYEFEHNAADLGTPQILRRQAYWALLSGAAGHLYGNGYTWPFAGGWQQNLDTPGSAQMGLVKALFESKPWHNLIPDQSHAVVTAGYGTFASAGSMGANDYLTAARTPDGALVMAYMPTVRTIAVNMAKLGAPATASWYDPASGAYVPIAGSPFANTGSRQFRPSGNNSAGDGDWVLVLDATASVPPDVQAPTVPGGLAVASVSASAIGIAWTASQDNTGVAGYQVYRDGGLVGTTSSPSYTDGGLSPLTSHSYTVAAYDFFNNVSAPSAPLVAATSGPAPAFVQQGYAVPQSPQSLVSATYAVAQTAGNTNILAIGWNDATAVLTSVSDSAGNTYQAAIPTFRSNGLSQAIYYAPNIAASPAGTQVTVTFDRPAVYVDLRATEYSGVSHTGAFDAGVSRGGSGTAADSGAVTASGASELLFAAGITSAVFTAPGPGFTTRVITSPDGDIVADGVTASAGSYHAGASLTSGTWILQLAVFRAAGP